MQLPETMSKESKYNTHIFMRKSCVISGVTCVNATMSLQLTWLSERFFTTIALKHSRLLGTQ